MAERSALAQVAREFRASVIRMSGYDAQLRKLSAKRTRQRGHGYTVALMPSDVESRADHDLYRELEASRREMAVQLLKLQPAFMEAATVCGLPVEEQRQAVDLIRSLVDSHLAYERSEKACEVLAKLAGDAEMDLLTSSVTAGNSEGAGVASAFVFCRFWKGFTQNFSYERFNDLDEEVVLGALRDAADQEGPPTEDITKWLQESHRRALQGQIHPRMPRRAQPPQAAELTPELKKWQRARPSGAARPGHTGLDADVILVRKLQFLGWLAAPVVWSRAFIKRHIIARAETLDMAKAVADALALCYADDERHPRFGVIAASSVPEAKRLVWSSEAEPVGAVVAGKADVTILSPMARDAVGYLVRLIGERAQPSTAQSEEARTARDARTEEILAVFRVVPPPVGGDYAKLIQLIDHLLQTIAHGKPGFEFMGIGPIIREMEAEAKRLGVGPIAYMKQTPFDHEDALEFHAEWPYGGGVMLCTWLPKHVPGKVTTVRTRPWEGPLDAFVLALSQWRDKLRLESISPNSGSHSEDVPQPTPAIGGRKRRGGRPRLSSEGAQRRTQIVNDWLQAKEAGVRQKDFCKDKNIEVGTLTKFMNWHAKRKPRAE